MADAPQIPDEAETRARWGAFAWTPENADKAKAIIARYPTGRQRSAVMPLLDLAQRQVGAETQTQGWLPVPVIEYVAVQLDMPFRSEEHTSELQSLMRISYAVFCLKKKKKQYENDSSSSTHIQKH